MLVLFGVAVWEILQQLGRALCSSCCGSPRAEQLRRLRDMARLAAEAEIDRALGRGHSAGTQGAYASVDHVVGSVFERRSAHTRSAATQAVGQAPAERVVDVPRDRVVYRDACRDPANYREINQVFMTKHGVTVHSEETCRGFCLAFSNQKLSAAHLLWPAPRSVRARSTWSMTVVVMLARLHRPGMLPFEGPRPPDSNRGPRQRYETSLSNVWHTIPEAAACIQWAETGGPAQGGVCNFGSLYTSARFLAREGFGKISS